MFSYLDFRCYFEANGQNHIHFRLILLRIAWHDIFSLSHHLLASWNLCIPRVPFYVFGIYFLFSFCCCCCFLIVVVAVIFVNYNGNRL